MYGKKGEIKMKINHLGNTSGINPYKKQLNKVEKSSHTSAKQGMDKVEISSAAKEMQQISQVELQRQERVGALKRQIESGNYQVDPKEVAKSIIQFFNKN